MYFLTDSFHDVVGDVISQQVEPYESLVSVESCENRSTAHQSDIVPPQIYTTHASTISYHGNSTAASGQLAVGLLLLA